MALASRAVAWRWWVVVVAVTLPPAAGWALPGRWWVVPARRPRASRARLVVSARGHGQVPGAYSWVESDEELEVRVPVPEQLRKGDIDFALTTRSLRVQLAGEAAPRLDGILRGKVTLDGSYWSLDSDGERKELVVRLEKKPDGMYDPEEWQGVLFDAGESEAVTSYDLDDGDKFDIEEYIESIGGYNESLVDKSMFSLDSMGADFLDDLKKSGLVKESPEDQGWAGAEDEPGETAEGASVAGAPPRVKTTVLDAQVLQDGPEDAVRRTPPTVTLEEARAGLDVGWEQQSAVQDMTVVQLKSALRERDLPLGGPKAELVARLQAALFPADAGSEEPAPPPPSTSFE